MTDFTPFSGSYSPQDIHFLLNPVEMEMTPVDQKEQLIQSGARHYSEMLSQEPEPTAWHLDIFSQALDRGAERLAKEVAILAQALAEDFDGLTHEQLRQRLINSAPKYGNDDDSVDELLARAYQTYIDEIKQYHNPRYGRGPIGGNYYAGTSSISANVPFGAATMATPDGRKAKTPLAEGASPASGTDHLGPTAVISSVGKLPTGSILGGVLLNQKLNPATLENTSDRIKLMMMLRTFFEVHKGWHIQYNIVSRETLLEAKKHPDQYRDLVVRVAGYSAFFTALSPDAQDDIIARTEHTL